MAGDNVLEDNTQGQRNVASSTSNFVNALQKEMHVDELSIRIHQKWIYIETNE